MTSLKLEEQRIRQAYAHRDACGKDQLYSWHCQDAIYIAYRQEAAWTQAFTRAGLPSLSNLEILDVGCGSGGWLRMLLEWGAAPARLHGLDLLEERITEARSLSPPDLDLIVGNAWPLPFPDNSMDLCAASTVFSSILDKAARRALAQEMTRVVKRGGWIMIFDFAISHPKNPDTLGIRKKEISGLFPDLELSHTVKLIFPPPLLRLLPPRLFFLALFLESLLPLICTHRLYQLRRPDQNFL